MFTGKMKDATNYDEAVDDVQAGRIHDSTYLKQFRAAFNTQKSRFPEMVLPLNHPFIDGFSLVNQAFPHLWKPPNRQNDQFPTAVGDHLPIFWSNPAIFGKIRFTQEYVKIAYYDS